MKAFLVLALISFAVLGCPGSGDDPRYTLQKLMTLESQGQNVGVRISYDGDGCQGVHGDYDDCREVIAVDTRGVRCSDENLSAAIDFLRRYDSAIDNANVYNKSTKMDVIYNAILELQNKRENLQSHHSCL